MRFIAFIFLFISSSHSVIQAQSKAKQRSVTMEREIFASSQVAWKVVADLGNYHKYAPGIDRTDVAIPFSDEVTETERTCSDNAGEWTEKCFITEVGKAYKCEVNTKAPDYPYPFIWLVGNFKVIPTNDGGSRIQLHFEYQFDSRFKDWMYRGILERKFKKSVVELLDNWESEISKQQAAVK